MIDLHLHTTASDGLLSPRDLVARAAAAGLRTISVTDHDTTAGLADARAAADTLGIALIPGIEITAVEAGRDVHVLGYYFEPDSRVFSDFLRQQRTDRVRRVREMCGRLSAMGFDISPDSIVETAAERTGKSVGRPAIADALIRAGYACDRDDAFERLIGEHSTAYVPRHGVCVADVVKIIQEAGGIASLAHPVLAGIDDLIPSLAARGLEALEAKHPDHPPPVEAHYRALAARLTLAISGGSDFHGDGTSNGAALGVVTLGSDDFTAFAERARTRRKSDR